MIEYSKRRNINRGYMKLEVWHDAIDIFRYCNDLLKQIKYIDFKLRAQLLDSAQSISSNIAEGYCRRSVNEYLYFLNVALGSAGELFTRMIGLKEVQLVSENSFDNFDQQHYKVENKLIALIKSLQIKQADGTWDQKIHESEIQYGAE